MTLPIGFLVDKNSTVLAHAALSVDPASGAATLTTANAAGVNVPNSLTAGAGAASSVTKLIRALTSVDGSGITPHPTITATFTSGSSNAWHPDFNSPGVDCFFYPQYLGSAATAASPNLFANSPFTSCGVSQSSPNAGPQFLASDVSNGGFSMYFPTYVSFSGDAIPLSWQHSGRYFYAFQHYAGYVMSVLVDGKAVGTFTTTTGAAWVRIDLGSVVTGIVTLLSPQQTAIAVGVDGTIASIAPGPVAAYTGDSYLARWSASTGIPATLTGLFGGLALHALAMCGIRDPMPDAVSGTGYLTTIGGPTFRSRLTPAILSTLDLILVAGGTNDDYYATGTDAQLQAEINTYFVSLRAANPTMVIAATGSWSWYESRSYNPALRPQKISAWVLAALQSVGGPWIFINNLTGGWITSAGTSQAGPGRAWLTGDGAVLYFTGALAAATGATIAAIPGGSALNWALPTASYVIQFSDGSLRTATLTNGSSAVTWTGAVTASNTAGCSATTSRGNAQSNMTDEVLPHPSPTTGMEYLAQRIGKALRSALVSMN